MSTYSSVTCYEVFDSVSEVTDVFSGFSARVTLQCAWSDRYNLMYDLLNTPQPWPKVTTGLTPYAVRCAAKPMPQGFTTSGQEIVYNDSQGALVDVEYNTTIIDLASEAIEPTLESLPSDYRFFNWSSGALLTEGESPSMVLKSLNIVRTRYRLAAVPTDVLNAVGYVNMYAYTSSILGLTFPAETLMFLPTNTSRSWTNFTSAGYTVTLKFGFKPQGWNKFWHASTQTWENIYFNGSIYRQYPLYDFSALLA